MKRLSNAEKDRIQRGLADSWRTYMGWYTPFITVNMIVLGWFVTGNPSHFPKWALQFFAICWSIFNVLGIFATVGLSLFTIQMAKGVKERQIVFPIRVAWTAVIANSVVLMLDAIQWIIVVRTLTK